MGIQTDGNAVRQMMEYALNQPRDFSLCIQLDPCADLLASLSLNEDWQARIIDH